MEYTIDNEKLEEITAIVNQNTDPEVTKDIVEIHLCATEWSEREDHQNWLDTASVEEIADWIASAAYWRVI